ncbi:MAG: twin-arginine translocation signal domain-containing protein, partial [Deltaproteobacteria bacterium]|nr:twin-arginine translocation signal domain-containing protein [Deltaproteobacteria bacterium]
MDRRDFLKSTSAAGALTLLPLAQLAGADAGGRGADGAQLGTESGRAYADLARTLQEVEAEYLSARRGITRAGDISDGHRFILHVLQTGLFLRFEFDSERPSFRRIVSPTRKLLGDNPDALYFESPIRGDRRYRIRGNTAGAVYTSYTVEAGGQEGGYPERTDGAINDTEMKIGEDGSYEILLGPDVSGPNTVRLPADARTVTTRSYFESVRSAAADQLKVVPVEIVPVEDPGPAPTPDDASIARSIRRV